MQYQNTNKNSFSWYFTTISLSAFIALAGFFIFSILGGLLFGYSLTDLNMIQMDMTNPEYIPYLKYTQALQSVFVFIVPCVFIAFARIKRDRERAQLLGQYNFSESLFSYLQINRLPQTLLVILAVSMIILAAPIINLSAEINSMMSLPDFMSGIEEWMTETEAKSMELVGLLLEGDKYYHLITNLLIIAILPAVSEELLFRGLLQNYLSKVTRNSHLGIFLAALLFSALHLQFLTFLPRLLLGMYLGYIFYWSKNLWLPIIAHFINNGVIVILLFFNRNITLETKFETIGSNGNMTWTIGVSIVLVGYLMWLFYKHSSLKKLADS